MKNKRNNAEIIYSETSYIKMKTRSIADERLSFRGGERLGDLSIAIEDGPTVRKVRRIIEKRVAQDYWSSKHRCSRRKAKVVTARNAANTMRNIYGRVPEGFTYCRMRAA